MSTIALKNATLLVIAAAGFSFASTQSNAQETIECRSHDYAYTECRAPLDEPQLIHQISSTSCIINRTWGFNPKTRRLWVADGCAGVFADPQGYHYGRGDRHDADARYYDERGHDSGKLAAGLVAAVLVGAALDNDSKSDKKKRKHSDYTTSNDYYSHPDRKNRGKSKDQVDTSPHFDKQGNPNYDTDGNYIGCHGVGCLVDAPEQ